MTGRVNRYNPNKHTGYIYNIVNGLTCMFKDSDVLDGDIDNGYIVEFGIEYDEEMQRKCAKRIRVIDGSNGIYKEDKTPKKKPDNNRHRKGCNADKVVKRDKQFEKFARGFMREQKERERLCQ